MTGALPEFQGRGIGKTAVRALLQLAGDADRGGLVHAFPATTNGPSNGICPFVGFRFAGQQNVRFSGRIFQASH
jgi:RimJ/RimL family protein N-acetyltransferase